jgi:hypothetical protein
MEKQSGDGPAVPLRADGVCLTGIPQDVAARSVGRGFGKEPRSRFSLGSIVLCGRIRTGKD